MIKATGLIKAGFGLNLVSYIK